jgi:Family of unknown function (DUF6504)
LHASNEQRVRKFVSRPITPAGEGFITPATGGEPPVPAAFIWNDQTLEVTAVVRSWRSTKGDRGDNYLKRHWFELETAAGARIEVYFDREARRGAPQWWLYTIDE